MRVRLLLALLAITAAAAAWLVVIAALDRTV
jgi:hypothetical protein